MLIRRFLDAVSSFCRKMPEQGKASPTSRPPVRLGLEQLESASYPRPAIDAERRQPLGSHLPGQTLVAPGVVQYAQGQTSAGQPL